MFRLFKLNQQLNRTQTEHQTRKKKFQELPKNLNPGEAFMEILFRESFLVIVATLMLILGLAVPFASAQSPAPAPVPSSDGVAIDQGIAYALMLVALVLTYIIH